MLRLRQRSTLVLAVLEREFHGGRVQALWHPPEEERDDV